ncbi:MAG TPA: hypothetical protein VKR31_01115 [Rhizomicrobium sp.]|nr:hypothetical protein [Rhizomicrobium sp.]
MRRTRVLHLAAIPGVLLSLACSSAVAGNPPVEQLFASACDRHTYSCPNEYNPNSPFQATDYGTAEFGGTGNAAAGTVFNLNGTTIGANSAKTVLFSLTLAGKLNALPTSAYPWFPNSPLTETADGKLFDIVSTNQDRSAPGMFGSNPSGEHFTEHTIAGAHSCQKSRPTDCASFRRITLGNAGLILPTSDSSGIQLR